MLGLPGKTFTFLTWHRYLLSDFYVILEFRAKKILIFGVRSNKVSRSGHLILNNELVEILVKLLVELLIKGLFNTLLLLSSIITVSFHFTLPFQGLHFRVKNVTIGIEMNSLHTYLPIQNRGL